MGWVYLIWIGSIVLCIFGWAYFRSFYRKHKRYFVPYLIFQLGVTLLVISIFIIGQWAGMAYGFISLVIMGLGLIIGLLIFIYSFVQKNDSSHLAARNESSSSTKTLSKKGD